MTINLTELGTKLSELVSAYSQETKHAVNARIESCADEILEYVKANAPRSKEFSNHLADSFVKTVVGEGENKIIYISSKSKYRLVHLVELGFRHSSGKHISGRPFLRPSYDKFTPQMMEDIKRIITHGLA